MKREKNPAIVLMPDLQAYKQGRDVYLAFSASVGFAMHRTHEDDCDEEAMHLAKTAAIVREDKLANRSSLLGSFEPSYQAASVPASLLSLCFMGQILKNKFAVQERYKQH